MSNITARDRDAVRLASRILTLLNNRNFLKSDLICCHINMLCFSSQPHYRQPSVPKPTKHCVRVRSELPGKNVILIMIKKKKKKDDTPLNTKL